VTYDVEGPDPVPRRSFTKPLRTVIVLAVLAVAVVIAGRWGWTQLTQPFGDESVEASGATADATPVCTPAPAAASSLRPPAEITVNVYNASGVAGAAAATAEALAAEGFQIGDVANDPLGRRVEGVGEIRSDPAITRRVGQFQRYVPGAEWVKEERPGVQIDFAIGTAFTGITVPEPLPDQPADNTDDAIPTC
jgi:hypothetical protein